MGGVYSTPVVFLTTMVDFICPFCDWEGTEPVTDAHMNAFCPECGRPVQFKAFYKKPPGGGP
ncbi:MAG: hypothetical protein V3U30_02240 [Thermoplasmata archaeon]